MDLLLQAKLLRVLQEKEVERLGGRQPIPLDVRIVATTNKKLEHQVEVGEFREDLFYRLSVFPIHWPALKDRRDDILPLAKYFLAKHIKKMSRRPVFLSPDAIDHISSYDWPGNVRELDNALQRALILQDGDTLHASDFNFKFCSAAKTFNLDNSISIKSHQKDDSGYKQELQNHEFNLIYDALVSSRGSKKHVAEKLGISPRTLRYKMAKMRDLGYTF